MHKTLLRIAVPSPLYRSFDYLLPDGIDASTLKNGVRVRVPFGRRTVIGVLLAVTSESAVETHKLKRALAILDREPVLNADVLAMVQWASDYYHHPIGDALTAALPVLLRQGEAPEASAIPAWRLTAAGSAVDSGTLARAARQQAIMTALQQQPQGLARSALEAPANVLRTLQDKGWIEPFKLEPATGCCNTSASPHTLNPAQQHAVDSILARFGEFAPFLLEGVTGSGKTEVYLTLVEQALAQQQQALVLVPEIGLTPQLVDRFQQRFPVPLAVLHSGLSDRERLNAWQLARKGTAPVIIGTRSAIFTPLPCRHTNDRPLTAMSHCHGRRPSSGC